MKRIVMVWGAATALSMTAVSVKAQFIQLRADNVMGGAFGQPQTAFNITLNLATDGFETQPGPIPLIVNNSLTAGSATVTNSSSGVSFTYTGSLSAGYNNGWLEINLDRFDGSVFFLRMTEPVGLPINNFQQALTFGQPVFVNSDGTDLGDNWRAWAQSGFQVVPAPSGAALMAVAGVAAARRRRVH